MATTPLVLLAIASLLLASLPYHGVSAPTPAAESPVPETVGAPSSSAGDGCMTALANMSDCLTFVEDGSKLRKPDKGCCPELAGLVDSNPVCLCQLLGNSDSIGIKINLNKALKLPSLCGVTTPPVSTCSAVGVPVSLPAPSSAPSSTEDSMPPSSEDSMPPNMAMTPKGGLSPSLSNSADSSAGVPSPSESKSGASCIDASVLTFIFAMSTLSFSIFF